MSIIILASTYAQDLIVALWVVLLLTFLPYLFMRIYDSGGLDTGNARIKFDFDEPLLMLISFFALTAYLQMHAIRFNSLVSVPLSIFGAYTVYWIATFCKRRKLLYFASLVAIAAIVIYMIFICQSYLPSLFPADNINPSFISAVGWLKNNSASSSVVLTLWPDGSVVEGVANLTSVTDSVGSQNASKADPFAYWLFNSSDDPQFLTSSINGRPDYLLVRDTWMLESGGIFTESGINASSNVFGYSPFSSISERMNATTQLFEFSGDGYDAQTVIRNVSGGRSFTSYLVFPNNGISPFKYIDFYDEDNATYSSIAQTGFNQTNNDTLLIMYSSVPNGNIPVNITNAYLMSSGIMATNLVKFLFMCGSSSCPWDNNLASLQLVHANPDTKIFRIIYNGTG